MSILKQLNELKEGLCFVVTEDSEGKRRIHRSNYSERLKVAFFTVPYSHKIIGYTQSDDKNLRFPSSF